MHDPKPEDAYALISSPRALYQSYAGIADKPTVAPILPKVAKWHGSNWIRKGRRYAIYTRDNWRCVWCSCRVAVGKKAKAKHLALAHLDHIRPRSNGGSNATENLITSCSRCNKRRGKTPAHVYAKRVGALVRLVEAVGKVLPK